MRSNADLAHDYADFVQQERATLLAGGATHDTPLGEGSPRWGMSTIMRPDAGALTRLADLGRSAERATGPGHWVHGKDELHFTLRSLESYRHRIPADDPARRTAGAALREAADGVGPVRFDLRGPIPHRGGIMVLAYPEDDTIWTLQRRYAEALNNRSAGDFESWQRDRWYVSLVHFARPLASPEAVLTWADEHAEIAVGSTEVTAVEIIQALQEGPRVRLKTLESAPLS
ncbi:hypothetical protein OIE66_39995 [Nonomuraea sp. NBC_01738]|uniref:hypothetical protein n=1 Tax=Nonomuraea sp. NBC_01738 TaxID=2976003 RepID=UPI002E0F4021|nr:hypothetical protein OIE66_39995 [Nonomuraea sp. NBC_01738]